MQMRGSTSVPVAAGYSVAVRGQRPLPFVRTARACNHASELLQLAAIALLTASSRSCNMEGFHHDAHKLLCTSAQLKQRLEQEQLHSSQKSRAAAVSLPDLPQPWLKLLVHQVDPWLRHALFTTCSGFAAAVVQHSSGLTLTPNEDLHQHSSRSTFVLKLAANSNDIYLRVWPHAMVCLDVPDVWPCIKQLRLCYVGLTTDTISNLHLQQLKQLHTIELVGIQDETPVDTAAVQHLMQADGLPALRTLTCLMAPAQSLKVLQQLGPVMGHRVTHLTVGSCLEMGALDKWPALQQIRLQSTAYEDTPVACSAAVKQVFEHPQLKEAFLPASMFSNTNFRHPSSTVSFRSGKLDVLELTELTGPHPALLLLIPLHAVRHLCLHRGIKTVSSLSTTIVQHLGQCSSVQILPSSWWQFERACKFHSIEDSTPTWEASCDPVLLEWLLPTLSKAEGALILCSNLAGHIQGAVGAQHTASLRLLPPGMHTLVLVGCAVDNGCTWPQLIAHVPQHVQSVVVCRCNISQEQFDAVLAQPPPSGLRRLFLASDCDFMSWVERQSEAVRTAVSVKWPGVELHLCGLDWEVIPECESEEEEEQEDQEDGEDDDEDEGGESEDLDQELDGYFGHSYDDGEYDEDDEYEGEDDESRDEGDDD